ncbi:hypothetical protein E0489_11680 [Thermus tengchongensis]|uniref:Uncharacterized protein n=2 Tax=Thermus tengchongensis TaxID=1214928 RepID=A0ABY2K3V7_9DEIN|nr:hypothetical protein E0489_11680 [Thermus tengchongensis]
MPASLSAPGPDDPIWLQLLYGARQIGSVLDPYIFTEQERAQMELERLRLEAEREKARQASIQVQPVAPTSPWVWALLAAVLAVLLLAVLLRD